MARRYFARAEAREASQAFYHTLRAAALRRDGEATEALTHQVMQRSIDLWRAAGDR
jgi:DNA-binding FadR family transcriptional regulator